MFFYNFMEQISKFICFCLFYHLPKLEASFFYLNWLMVDSQCILLVN